MEEQQDVGRRRSPRQRASSSQLERQQPLVKKPKKSARPEPTLVALGTDPIQKLGDAETGMCIVLPPKEDPALLLLERLEKVLSNDTHLKAIDAYIAREQTLIAGENTQWRESGRKIQGKRVEVFLEAQDKASSIFDEIIAPQLGHANAKEMLLNFARTRARLDPRVGNAYKFENFSLLIGRGRNPSQAPHLDLVLPNFQFGLMLTKKSRGTHFVPDPTKPGPVRTVQQLTQLWETNPAFSDPVYSQVPNGIVDFLNSDDGALQLLQYFGDTLQPEATLEASFICPENVPLGALASLPGGVVHAGPASHGPRTILFFSGSELHDSEVDSYMPDSQYNGVTLMGHLVSILWRRDNVTPPVRKYLLRKLLQYIEGAKSKDVAHQFVPGKLQDCVKALQSKSFLKKGMTLDDFIDDRSRDSSIVVGNDPFSQTSNVVDVNDLKLVSIAKDLYTPWMEPGMNEEQLLPIMVYERIHDGNIIIRYLTDGAEADSPDEYEGVHRNDNLRLEMDPGHKKFNGENGRLYDTDGNLIEVRRLRRRS
jgi:hypothetical protein